MGPSVPSNAGRDRGGSPDPSTAKRRKSELAPMAPSKKEEQKQAVAKLTLGANAPVMTPSLGKARFDVSTSTDWDKLHKNTFLAPLRPASASVDFHSTFQPPAPKPKKAKASAKKNSDASSGPSNAQALPPPQARVFRFGLKNQEEPKDKPSQVRLNPFYKTKEAAGTIVYSRASVEASDSDDEGAKKRKKFFLDEVDEKHQPAFAGDVLRVMKGTANSKGLRQPDEDQRTRALVAGTLIMTSERMRSPLNPHNAAIELYKVKHGAGTLESAFHPETGTFVAAQSGGAAQSRKIVDEEHLAALMRDANMKRVFDNYASKKPKHKDKDFAAWTQYKWDKLTKRFKG
jgi:hypothetical protein